MITQCSYCSTKFEISKELIESQDPRVRCGECLNVFNAKMQRVVEEEFSEPSVPTVTQKVQTNKKSARQKSPADLLESYISADDLENAATIVLDDPPSSDSPTTRTTGAERVNDAFYSPDLDYDKSIPDKNLLDSTTLEFEQTMLLDAESDNGLQNSPREALAPAALQTTDEQVRENLPDVALRPPPVVDETLDRESMNRDVVRSNADFGNESAVDLRRHVHRRGGEVLPLVGDAQTRASSQPKSMLIPLLCCAVALLGVLYLARDRIAQLDLPAPVLTTFCNVTGCTLGVVEDLDSLELLRHKMSSHPTLQEVLVINVDLINRAHFPQPYPVLAITMSDAQGNVVATRKFQPADYLEPEALENTLPSEQLVRIRFEILDPGPEASSSTLVFE